MDGKGGEGGRCGVLVFVVVFVVVFVTVGVVPVWPTSPGIAPTAGAPTGGVVVARARSDARPATSEGARRSRRPPKGATGECS